MNRKLITPVLLCLAIVAGSIAVAEEMKEPGQKAAEMKLPPGWTAEDMQACAAAATPGKNHAFLAKTAGTWSGKSTFWMFPDSPATESPCTVTVASVLDGRFIKIDWTGEMPGMGPFTGFGQQGFDNQSGKFVGTWIDSMSTGIMPATGEMSADGKSITWTYNFTCPINNKPSVMRQVETFTSDTSKTIDMWGPEPKTGKEFKMMHVELTKK